jgi:hypothetical protein
MLRPNVTLCIERDERRHGGHAAERRLAAQQTIAWVVKQRERHTQRTLVHVQKRLGVRLQRHADHLQARLALHELHQRSERKLRVRVVGREQE